MKTSERIGQVIEKLVALEEAGDWTPEARMPLLTELRELTERQRKLAKAVANGIITAEEAEAA